MEDHRTGGVARNPLTHVEIHARQPSAVGFVACALLVGLLAFLTARNTGDWCAAEYRAFFMALGIALALDACVAQVVLGAAALGFEYLSDDREEQQAVDEAELDGDGRLREQGMRRLGWRERERFALHPVHGQWQDVGALVSPVANFDADE
jgi:hypothetical protein